MVQIQYFYRKDTEQIDAIFRDCQTNSAVWKDVTVYVEVNVEDPPYMVTRDHKVVLAVDGNVIGTVYSPNPFQPLYLVTLPLCQHVGKITAFQPGNPKPLVVTITYRNVDFSRSCYVTQDVADAYVAGTLHVGDWVIVDFLEGHEDKPIAAQKVYKTW